MSSIRPRTGPATPREASRIYGLCVGLENAGSRVDYDDPKVQEIILRWMRLVWAEYRREAKTLGDAVREGREKAAEARIGGFDSVGRRPEE